MVTNYNVNTGIKLAPLQHNKLQLEAFRPQVADVSILERAMDKIERKRMENSVELGAMDTAFASLEEQLHNDDDTRQWFYDYRNNVKRQIDEQIQVGNYSRATRLAKELAGKILQDPAMQGRIDANTAFKENEKDLKQRFDKGEITKNTYEYALYKNKYHYEDKFNENGDLIRGEKWEPDYRPVADIDWGKVSKYAFDLCTKEHESHGYEDSKSDTSLNGIDITIVTAEAVNGKKSDKPNIKSVIRDSQGYRCSYDKVTKERIKSVMGEIMTKNPDAFAAMKQDFDVRKYTHEKQLEELENLKTLRDTATNDSDRRKYQSQYDDLNKQLLYQDQILYKNGAVLTDFNEYATRMIQESLFANNLAYHWKDTYRTSKYAENGSITGGFGGGGGGNNTDKTDQVDAVSQGPATEQGGQQQYGQSSFWDNFTNATEGPIITGTTSQNNSNGSSVVNRFNRNK